MTLQPAEPDTSPRPLPLRGSQANEISAPASRRIIDGEAQNPGRSYLGRTGDLLDMGRAPDMIDRATPAANAGGIDGHVSGWPYDGNALLIPHQSIPRRPITVTPFVRNIDTGVTIPSISIGDPAR